ncbi:MAG: nuclear transport factor 2 family protein [Pyrinomonadaceae bacterium]
MRSILLLVVFAATIPLLANGQTEPKTKPTAPAGQQSSAVEQALIRLDRELMDAAVRKDRTMFERTALTRYVFVNPGGGVEERSDSADGPNIESIQTENVVVRVDGDMAVLTGKASVKGKLANGRDISGQYTYMRVFVKQQGQWRLAAMSAVPIAQGQPTPSSAPQPMPTPTP